MAHALTVSQAGFDLVKRFEGFQSEPLSLPDGWWLLGFNHVTAQEHLEPLTQSSAEDLLRQDLRALEAKLNAHVFVGLTQEQFDALASFVFSIGWEAFRDSAVLRHLNAGAFIAAADCLLAWRYGAANGLPGLLSVLARRRAIEAAWLLDQGVHVPVASAWIRPRLEEGAPSLERAIGEPSMQPGPAESSGRASDAITERLRAILAAEPASARNLLPPVVHEEVDDELEPVGNSLHRMPSAAAGWLETTANDHITLGSFAVMGSVLVGVGLGLMASAPDFAKALAGVLFAVPGAAMAGGALFLLFRGAITRLSTPNGA